MLAISAYGGPVVHFSLITRSLVKKRNYLSEAELLELHSFCQMLPGPTSTQMITSIGYKLGGASLAFLSLLVWILPATLIMTGFVLAWNFTDKQSISLEFLQFIQPMAVGFIAAAAIRIFGMMQRKNSTVFLFFTGAVMASAFPSPYIFPVLIVFGGVVSRYSNKEDFPAYKPIINVRWSNFVLFISILVASAVIGAITKSKPVLLFENTYRYGSYVFGGGNVLIPMMFEQFVSFKKYMTSEDFITGVGLVQAIPGPVFSFSTYANGMAMQDWGVTGQLLGCLIGTVAIFFPGILMIFFIYPIWDQVKQHPLIRKAIEGITAISAGLVLSAAYLLFKETGYEWQNILVMVITVALVIFTRVPSPVIVLATVVAGFVL